MEPSQPVDPVTGPAPAIPQARRSTEDPSQQPHAPVRPDQEDAGRPAAATPEGGPTREGAAGDGRPGGHAHEDLPPGPPAPGAPPAEGKAAGEGPTVGESTGGESTGEVSEDGEPEDGSGAPGVWNRRSILLVVMAVVMALATAGYVVGYLLYDKAVEPDRSTPGVAVRQYMTATFDDRETMKARRFTCGDPAGITEIQGLLQDISTRERSHNVKISVSIDGVEAKTSGKTSEVSALVHLAATVDGRGQEQLQRWRFELQRRSGWRVCDAHRIS